MPLQVGYKCATVVYIDYIDQMYIKDSLDNGKDTYGYSRLCLSQPICLGCKRKLLHQHLRSNIQYHSQHGRFFHLLDSQQHHAAVTESLLQQYYIHLKKKIIVSENINQKLCTGSHTNISIHKAPRELLKFASRAGSKSQIFLGGPDFLPARYEN